MDRLLVRVGRIELPSTAWEAVILPLNHTREYLYFTSKRITKKFLCNRLFLIFLEKNRHHKAANQLITG